MAHAQKPDFVFRRNGRVHLNRRGRHVSRVLTAEVCASAVVMLDTPCSEVVWRALATHSIRQFPLHFPSRTSRCAITFQQDSTYNTHRALSDWMQTQNKYRLTTWCQTQGLQNRSFPTDLSYRSCGCKSCPVGKWVCRNLGLKVNRKVLSVLSHN